jgi:hypothetical protein
MVSLAGADNVGVVAQPVASIGSAAAARKHFAGRMFDANRNAYSPETSGSLPWGRQRAMESSALRQMMGLFFTLYPRLRDRLPTSNQTFRNNALLSMI